MKKMIQMAVLLSLLGGLAYGWTARKNTSVRLLAEHFSPLPMEKISSEPEGYQVTEQNRIKFFAYPGMSTGWGGPMKLSPIVDPEGKIIEVLVLEHRETPLFFQFLQSNGFFEQFKGKGILDPLELGRDIDGITGATISSRAITKAVKKGMISTAKAQMNTNIAPRGKTWSAGRDEIFLFLLYAGVVFCILFKIRKPRIASLVLGFLFLGLTMKSPVSISNLAALFMGHVPDIHDHLFWWMLVPGTLALIIFLGKNFYCLWICPFGALQELIAKTGGMAVAVPLSIQKRLKLAAKAVTWLALMIAFCTNNAATASFEPFAALFSLKGSQFQWYLLSMAIAGSFIIPRFWCRFFCPVGVCFNLFSRTKKCLKRKNNIQPGMKGAAHEKV